MPKAQRVSCLDRDVKKPNRGAPPPLQDVLGNRLMYTIYIKGLVHNKGAAKLFIRTVVKDILKELTNGDPLQIKVLGGGKDERTSISVLFLS